MKQATSHEEERSSREHRNRHQTQDTQRHQTQDTSKERRFAETRVGVGLRRLVCILQHPEQGDPGKSGKREREVRETMRVECGRKLRKSTTSTLKCNQNHTQTQQYKQERRQQEETNTREAGKEREKTRHTRITNLARRCLRHLQLHRSHYYLHSQLME